MSSRVEKYYQSIHNETSSQQTRSSRNANLYREVYGKYDNLDNLPLEDNTNEIDMEKLKELVSKTRISEKREVPKNLNILEQRKRNIDEQKIYDINKILEKAKYENNKLKDTPPIRTKSLLSTLESKELTLKDIKEMGKKYETYPKTIQEETEKELSMTREIKYQNLEQEVAKENLLTAQVMPDNDLSLDLFSDLKPTENTITTKPIKEQESKQTINKVDLSSGNTKDIDIIKSSPKPNQENTFFTDSYEFSKKDFADYDELDEPKKTSNFFKIFFLIIAIIIFAGVIIYFVKTYGLGIK